MRKLYAIMIACIVSTCIFNVPFSGAVSDNIVISQIKTGNSTTSRLIEIYNNSENSVDITGWCFYYSSPSNTTPFTKIGCFDGSELNVHVFLGPKSFALAASAQTGLSADMIIEVGLGSGTSGHVYLTDSDDNEIDRVGWGTAVNAEASKPIIVDSTKVIERNKDISTELFIDTDDNESDFFRSVLKTEYQYGALFEVVDICSNLVDLQELVSDGYELNSDGTCNLPPVDICQNLDGLQTILPTGHLIDEIGDCQADVCNNLDGLQLSLPDRMELDSNGGCVVHDVCLNLPDIQSVVPDGYVVMDDNCTLDLLPLKISELLPNAVGTDDGHEFIEIYNPNPSAVDLTNYVLYIGSSIEHSYSFSVGIIIEPGEYMAFYSDDIKFTLVNTTSSVTLKSLDNELIDETPYYLDPKDGMAWALIDDVWQFTNRPTPGTANIASYIEPVVVKQASSTLKPCGPGQYRNPETNRCKSISSDSSLVPCKVGQYRSEETGRCKAISSGSNLVPCKVGQYRSEETGRCRNIVSDVSNLIPCAEGQERNPATNRCRSVSAVLAATSLVPCKEGQERNPETNRCRNIVGDMPVASFAVEQTSARPDNSIVWWSLAGVGGLAIIYGIWEWRQEIMQLVKKVANVLNMSK